MEKRFFQDRVSSMVLSLIAGANIFLGIIYISKDIYISAANFGIAVFFALTSIIVSLPYDPET